ncbi:MULTISPECIES: hypothetical protein [unclassified Bradyrhizobium]|uniref:hypothetical protein n=1 Tax=unclassified Bradyrhizobium TaxID=2631580 RepID=UPI003394AB09
MAIKKIKRAALTHLELPITEEDLQILRRAASSLRKAEWDEDDAHEASVLAGKLAKLVKKGKELLPQH